jgi:CheY-like chemotaxis protein
MEHYDNFSKLLERCCGDGAGHGNTFRALCVVEKLFILDLAKYERLLDRIAEYLSVMRTKEAWDKTANDRLNAIVKDVAKRCESLKVLAQKELDLTNIIQRTAPKGPLRTEAIVSLLSKLQDSGLILKAEMARSIANYVHSQLKVAEQDWKDIAHLCEIAGLCGQKGLIEPIKLIYGRASGLGLKSAAKNALLRLGVTEAEINRRSPITSILVVEPSAFFRKRLVDAIKGAGDWEVRESGSKEEADGLLKEAKADLMIAECVEEGGKLLSWLQSIWDQNRVKYVYLCTSNRDLAGFGEPPWLIGILHKPFPMEKLLAELAE